MLGRKSKSKWDESEENQAINPYPANVENMVSSE